MSNSKIKDSGFCPHGFDVACLFCGFGTADGVRVWHRRPKPPVLMRGARVQVDFYSCNRVDSDGAHIHGVGTVDRVDPDGFVYGRLDNRLPFGCPSSDVKVLGGAL